MSQKNIGIVTTWFERGAAYVSRNFESVLSHKYEVFIYARGGEKYAVGDKNWDKSNVTWGKRRFPSFSGTLIDKSDFKRWIFKNKIDIVLFNEQEWWLPVLWCNEWKIPTICYVDYYTADTRPFFNAYNFLICNTKRHYQAFEWHKGAFYLPWGTDIDLFQPQIHGLEIERIPVFFHSCGLDPHRKGTEILIKAFSRVKNDFKLIIHTQVNLSGKFDSETESSLKNLQDSGKTTIIEKTVTAPGLYHYGDFYVYPTRLEGIGLTVAESQACGLIPIVTNNGPVNEFVDSGCGYLIDVKQFFARSDGYFWPECEPEVEHLTDIIDEVTMFPTNKINELKLFNRQHAEKNLNWKINSKQIFDLVEQINYYEIDKDTKNSIVNFEKNGFRKLNIWYLKFFFVLNPLYFLIRKLKLNLN